MANGINNSGIYYTSFSSRNIADKKKPDQSNETKDVKNETPDKKALQAQADTAKGVFLANQKAQKTVSKPSEAMPTETAGVEAAAKVSDKKAEQKGEYCGSFFYISDQHGELKNLAQTGTVLQIMKECGIPLLHGGDAICGTDSQNITATMQVLGSNNLDFMVKGNHEDGKFGDDIAKVDALKEHGINVATITDLAKQQDVSYTLEDGNIIASSGENQTNVVGKIITVAPGQKAIFMGAGENYNGSSAEQIAQAIDSAVQSVREQDSSCEGLPVVMVSHLGSDGDAAVIKNSNTINFVCGAHTHTYESKSVENNSGKEVSTIQLPPNNKAAFVVQMYKDEDGNVSFQPKPINLQDSPEKILDYLMAEQPEFANLQTFDRDTVLEAAQAAKTSMSDMLTDILGENEVILKVGKKYNMPSDPTERNYSNPVLNIMADALLEAGKDKGAVVSLINPATIKDTEIQEGDLTSYDIRGRLLPFGGSAVVVDVDIAKIFEKLDEGAKKCYTDDSELTQVSNLQYFVDVDKAYSANEKGDTDGHICKRVDMAVPRETAELINAISGEEMPSGSDETVIVSLTPETIDKYKQLCQEGKIEPIQVKCVTTDFYAKGLTGKKPTDDEKITTLPESLRGEGADDKPTQDILRKLFTQYVINHSETINGEKVLYIDDDPRIGFENDSQGIMDKTKAELKEKHKNDNNVETGNLISEE